MSPFSLHSVLSMLTLGAGGDTEIEMLKGLGFNNQFLVKKNQCYSKYAYEFK